MYERDAISSHLEAHKTDPLTRLPLRSDQLTPVYLLRARAAEYRESAAAACVEAASSPACKEAVSRCSLMSLCVPVNGLPGQVPMPPLLPAPYRAGRLGASDACERTLASSH